MLYTNIQGARTIGPVQEIQWGCETNGRSEGAVQGWEASEEPQPSKDGQGWKHLMKSGKLKKLSFNVNHSNLCTYLQVYQSMAKAMDPQMLRAIGGMQGIESMMKQMQQGGAMPGGMGMQGMEQMLKKKGKKWWKQMKQHLFQSAYVHEKW